MTILFNPLQLLLLCVFLLLFLVVVLTVLIITVFCRFELLWKFFCMVADLWQKIKGGSNYRP